MLTTHSPEQLLHPLEVNCSSLVHRLRTCRSHLQAVPPFVERFRNTGWNLAQSKRLRLQLVTEATPPLPTTLRFLQDGNKKRRSLRGSFLCNCVFSILSNYANRKLPPYLKVPLHNVPQYVIMRK